MKLFLTIIFTALIINVAVSDELVIKPERMITDYNGVVSNNNILLCYGDYGIITLSKDLGKTWGQISIGDKHNILEINEYNNEFYAVSEYSIFHSSDGINWTEKNLVDEPILNNIAVANDNMYILAKDAVYESNRDLEIKKLFDLDTMQIYADLETDSTNLYMIMGLDKILTYDIENDILDSIQVNIEELDINKNRISRINIHELELYMSLSYSTQNPNDVNFENINSTNLYKLNEEVQWENLYDNFTMDPFYFIENDQIFTASRKSVYIQELNIYLEIPIIHQVWGDNIVNTVTDTSNKAAFNFYNISIHPKDYTGFRRINDNTLCIVGKDKLILISNDGGKTWEAKSNYKATAIGNSSFSPSKKFYVDSEKRINVNHSMLNGVLNSNNGGITWLPDKRNYEVHKNIHTGVPTGANQFFEDENSNSIMINRQLISKAKNGGKDFTFERTRTFNYYLYPYRKGIKVQNNIMFAFHENQDMKRSTKLFFFDETSFELNDSIEIDHVWLKKPIITENNELISLGYIRKNYDETEKEYEIYKFELYKSTDGKNWETIDVETPFLKYYPDGSPADEIKGIYHYRNYILMVDGFSDSRIVYIYDYNENTIDSLELPAKLNRLNLQENMFVFRDKLYFVSSDYMIYFTEDISGNEIEWDSVNITQHFHNWEPLDQDNRRYNTDAIYSAITDGNKQIYLATGKYIKGSGFGDDVELNFARLFAEDDPVSVKEIETSETNNVYLYAVEPYPNPAQQMVNFKLYWNNYFSIDDAIIKVYDIRGNEVNNPEIIISKYNSYNCLVSWQCTGTKPGIYFINIKLANDEKTVPVVISR